MTLALAVAATGAAAEERTLKLHGYAYDLESNRFLYTEVHEQRIVGDRWIGGTIDYYAADGSPLGRKTMDFSQDPFVPVYRLDLKARGGYMESITGLTPGTIEMAKQGYGEKAVERASVKRAAAIAADSGFHTFIRANFPDLVAGKTVTFMFAVAGSLDAFRFRIKRLGDTTFEGRPAVKLGVEPDSLLRLLFDRLELTYEPEDRKLVEYRGVSNVHDPATGEAWNVRIIYPTQRPADAPAPPAGR